jgi:glucan phosphoethanolaminetransferase (alkaline phosphatase superfamily)
MYILVIMSIIAAVMFHKTALAKGYLSPRFWMYPIIVGNGLLLFVVALKWFVKTFMQEQGSPLLDAYFPLVDILAMVLFFLVTAILLGKRGTLLMLAFFPTKARS